MISLPKPPKPPGRSGKLGAWKDYLERLRQWVHVMEQLQAYERHKYAVKKMDLREIGDDGEFRAPKFGRSPRQSRPFPKNKMQREFEKRRRAGK